MLNGSVTVYVDSDATIFCAHNVPVSATSPTMSRLVSDIYISLLVLCLQNRRLSKKLVVFYEDFVDS
jgi:hypothetical protein